MKKNRHETFSIGDAAKMTGASQKQIRHWEAKGYIPKSERIVCGDRAYRRFTADQVQIIRSIKNYLEEGYTLPHSSRMAMQDARLKRGA